MAEESDKALQLQVLTPDKKLFSGAANYIKAPGEEGYFGVLLDHAPLLSELQIGELEVEVDNNRQLYAISGGFLEVLNNRVSVLAETAEKAEHIDVERAKEAKERAENRLQSDDPNVDYERARSALYRAINRMKISEKG